MAPASKPRLSASETFGLVVAIAKTLSVASFTFITALFRGRSGHRLLFRHVAHRALRTMNGQATARQIQAINPPTDEAYASFAKSHGFEKNIVDLPTSGGKILWMGNPSSPKVMVCFHGGGYVYPAAAQFGWCWDLLKKGGIGQDTAVAILSMSLAPAAQYPTQLRQAVEMLEHLTRNAGKRPEDIIIEGDSGGAQLGLALVSHLLHPHPLIPALKLSGSLAGLALISPWVTPKTTSNSFTRNGGRDLVNGHVLSRWASYALGSASLDEYNAPVTANATWWNGIKSAVKNIIVTAGTEEVLFDDIQTLVGLLEPSMPDMQVLFVEETHDQPLMDPLLGMKEDCESSEAVKSWIASNFE
ncbi:alpha/beta-hydrolase [Cryphonectria parasitica EP155]|uniref:Alpha/beta-hydrolase n=1 Tax=Cryphonectria parasitica (strain ATCC 38755 / EP155) TaxID=660469 RepID=A0A9P4Y359_CRYP1|nr:alpha/beta-hydrolase [Cryphonectria parasitica EP155]KAF3765300.1 alpha/beta-hydrolase [Cryphonectria parasitica EP155]